MDAMSDRYDSALLGILQHCGKIDNFLNVVFSFLFRRTDFYLIMEHEKDTKGFPPGVASKLAYTSFKRYEEMAKEILEKKKAISEVPPVARTEVVEADAEKQTESSQVSEQSSEKETCSTDTNSECPQKNEQSKAKPQKTTSPNSASGDKSAHKTDKDSKASNQKSDSAKKSEASGGGSDDDDPELTKQQKTFQANPESYNGAIRDNYSWSQQIGDVDVRIQVPKYVKKGKCVKVNIQRKRLKAEYLDDTGKWLTAVDGELTWDVNKEDSMWTLVPGEHIHINMEKIQERWWEAVYTTEPHISVRKIDPSRPMTDLDDEAQAKIEEMMYNERQKKLGLPQSHEQKVHNMLEKAWDSEGSPFRGQPFDPSKVNVQSGSM